MPHTRTTRLAPSPTGALHLGNARTFAITWALARQRGWKIVLRIEDLDGPRIKQGAAQSAIETLAWLGLNWDDGPIVQSHDLEPYRDAMRRLARDAKTYPSALTRSQIESGLGDAALSAPQEGSHEAAYPASLRPDLRSHEFDARPIEEPCAWRFATPRETVEFRDEFVGTQRHTPASTIGDFIIWTKSDQPAYQLAVVVDDHRQGVTDVVRGNDLLDSAARQILLYRALGYTQIPTFTHLPLVRGMDGKRLAKRHGDTRIDHYRAHGVPPERVMGLIAFWSGMQGTRQPLSAPEFARAFDLATLSPRDVTFTPEDDAWLLSR
jgi:glutamyl-tRNA synthetase